VKGVHFALDAQGGVHSPAGAHTKRAKSDFAATKLNNDFLRQKRFSFDEHLQSPTSLLSVGVNDFHPALRQAVFIDTEFLI